MAEHLAALGHVRDAGGGDVPGLAPLDLGAGEADGARLGIERARDRLQERRLARAVRAEHGDDRALAHVEAHALERRDRAIIGFDVAQLEEGHHAAPR
jgi:hypothetical protein